MLAGFSLVSGYQFGTKVFRNYALATLGVFCALVVLLGEVALDYNQQQIIKLVKNSLQTVLATTEESLTIWLGSQKKHLEQVGQSEPLIHLTASLLKEPQDPGSLKDSKVLSQVRGFFEQHQDADFGEVGFFIINRSYISIGSMRDTNLGTINLIAKAHPELMDRVFQGETVFVPPMRSDIPLDNEDSAFNLPPTLFILAPIIDFEGKILAAVAKRMDPAKEFSKVIQLGRIGNSGETYGFNQAGLMLSQSRFDAQLRKAGIIAEGGKSILALKIKDPGRDLTQGGRGVATADQQPLTLMAMEATHGRAGVNVEGYRDYRGVPVYGAWLWNSELEFGLATEIDVKEALTPYHALRFTLVGIIGIVLSFASIGIVFTLIFGERAYRILSLATEDLEAQVAKRTHELEQSERDLIDALVDAEKATQVKSSFLANMSHEIRTPMNAIIGFTDVLKETQLEEMQRKHLNTVNHSAKSLLTLLNDILDIAKLDEGKLSLESVLFNLKTVGEDVLSTLVFKARDKKLDLVLDYSDQLPPCFAGDPTRLRQVLINLVGNSIKFTHEGSVTIKIELGEQPEFVHFQVLDTGIGIPQNRLESIFESFSQADASTTRKYGGTGLGTTISRQLVECMEGKIWAESEEGKGSVFHFTAHLPAAECTAVDDKELRLIQPEHHLKILLAEDIPENVELASFRLTSVGHEVFVAPDGLEAVQVYRAEGPFDIILMDIQMPKLDGIEATRRIRAFEAEHHRAQVPIVALSASILEEDRVVCFEAGMDGFVGKPIDFHELFAEISALTAQEMAEPQAVAVGAGFPPLAGVDTVAGLEKWQDPGLYRRSLRTFLQHHEQDADQVETALKNKMKKGFTSSAMP